MVTKCTECGKRTVVLYPDLWVYKRGAGSPGGQRFFCSWHCLRAYDKGDETAMKQGRKVSEKSMKAVQIALEGGDPQKYLEECWNKNPSAAWYAIKQQVKENDPETYDRLPKIVRHKKEDISAAEAMQNCQDAADDFFGKCADMGLKVEIPERTFPLPPLELPAIEYKVTGIDTEMGNFQYYRKNQYMDWTPVSCPTELVSMNIDEWKQLIRDLPAIMKILGVEL